MKKETSLKVLAFDDNFKNLKFRKLIDTCSVWMSQDGGENVHVHIEDEFGNTYTHLFTDMDDLKRLVVEINFADGVNSVGLLETEIHTYCQVKGDIYRTVDFSLWDLIEANSTNAEFAGQLMMSVWKGEAAKSKRLQLKKQPIAA